MQELRQRQPRAKANKYLTYIRSLPCRLCGTYQGIQAAHIRFSDFRFEKRECGKQERPDDKWTTPLCGTCHDAQHDFGCERKFWESLKIDIAHEADQRFKHWEAYGG